MFLLCRYISRYLHKVDNAQRALYSSVALSQWLDVRLQAFGVAAVTLVAVIAVLQHQFGSVDPGGESLLCVDLSQGLLFGRSWNVNCTKSAF